MSEYAYSDAERAAIYRAIGERRDMRHFAGGEVAPELLGACWPPRTRRRASG